MRTIQSSLSNALFSKVRQCVLALLYGQPDRSFHTNEIIRLTHSGTGARPSIRVDAKIQDK